MGTVVSINAAIDVTGGANRFCNELNRLMARHGERVITFTCRPGFPVAETDQNIVRYFINKKAYPHGLWDKAMGLADGFFNSRILDQLENIIETEHPTVAHIHNIYHRIPYGIVDVLKKHGIKSLWWLHDYKWICPNHQLFTQGALCKRCRNGNFTHAVLHRCQVNSFVKSVIISCFAYFVSRKRYRDKIDLFIAPSQNTGALFREFGFPISKVRVLPHFNYRAAGGIDPVSEAGALKGPPFALYIGRLEENKGLEHLVLAFGKAGFPLKIIGTGNRETALRKLVADNRFSSVDLIGYVPPEKLADYFSGSLFIVVPSVWYEVFGLAIIEAFNYGKPVVASNIGAIPEIVENGMTGLLYKPGDIEDLFKKSKWMFENPGSAREMGRKAEEQVSLRFSPEKYWSALMNIHHELQAP